MFARKQATAALETVLLSLVTIFLLGLWVILEWLLNRLSDRINRLRGKMNKEDICLKTIPRPRNRP